MNVLHTCTGPTSLRRRFAALHRAALAVAVIALGACGGSADAPPPPEGAPEGGTTPPAIVPTGLSGPTGVAVDAAGNVYIGEITNPVVWKLQPDGVLAVFAGLAQTGGISDGTSSAARFDEPSALAIDAAGQLYVGDISSCDLRAITAAAVVTTLAGIPENCHGNAVGVGTPGSLGQVRGTAVDAAGNVYFSQFGQGVVSKRSPGGTVTTLAGNFGVPGYLDGTGTSVRFNSPYGVAVDSAGNVFVADSGNNVIRKITAAGVVTTFAGSVVGTSSEDNIGSADGTGPAAQFNDPNGVAVDNAGNVYVADFVNETVRKITPAGVVTTLAGLARTIGSDDGVGSAARFNGPTGVAVDATGNVYVADTENHAIRKITPGGVVTTLAR